MASLHCPKGSWFSEACFLPKCFFSKKKKNARPSWFSSSAPPSVGQLKKSLTFEKSKASDIHGTHKTQKTTSNFGKEELKKFLQKWGIKWKQKPLPELSELSCAPRSWELEMIRSRNILWLLQNPPAILPSHNSTMRGPEDFLIRILWEHLSWWNGGCSNGTFAIVAWQTRLHSTYRVQSTYLWSNRLNSLFPANAQVLHTAGAW